jgi:hypothetical protein
MRLEINTNFEVVATGQRYTITGFDVYVGNDFSKKPSVTVCYRSVPIQPGGTDSTTLEVFDAAVRGGDLRIFLTPEQQAS